MNKQELIERYKMAECVMDSVSRETFLKFLLKDLEELDEPEKVKVPQFVADWITHSKNIGRSLFGAMSIFEENFEIKKWMQWAENQETFALAWIFGYDVEEEKKFFVKIKCLSKEYKYLNYFKSCREWLFSEKEETKEYRTAHTRKELEEAGFSQVFNSPLFEVVEAE